MLKPKRKITRREIKKDPLLEKISQAEAIIRKKSKQISYITIGLVVIIVLSFIIIRSKKMANREAAGELGIAELSIQRGDYDDAILRLEKLVDTYTGTKSAGMAEMLLAQIYLSKLDYENAEERFQKYINDFAHEDTTLPYPESRACAEIVKAGQGRQSGAKFVFSSMGLAAFIELFKNQNGILIIKDSVRGFLQFGLSKINLLNAKAQVLTAGVQKAEFSQKGGMLLQSPAASPAFLGVGYIIGFKLSAITFSGGLFGWLFLMPIVLFLMYNNLHPFAEVGGNWINVAVSAYNSTVKPIAVGGMLVGAFYTLFKMRKNLIGGIARGFSDIRASKGSKSNKIVRTEKDAPFGLVLIAIGVLILCMIFLYHSFTAQWGSAILAAVVMGIAGFVFAAVAGYLVGIIGSSSNPISGLTLSTLLIAALLMVLVGMKGNPGIAAVLGVASVVCCVAGVAGDMLQDWKVGHILGGTPWKMQVGGMIGVIAAALVLIIPIMILHEAYEIGSDALPAPQAGLMAMMSKGIVGGEMAWPLVITGMFFAIALILIGSPSPMLISVGMYLPFSTTFAIFIGGLIKHITDRVSKKHIKNQKDKNIVDNTGLLVASGLVAGEALLGIILAGLVVGNINLSQLVGLPVDFQGFWWLGLVIFLVLGYVLIKYPYNELIKAQSKEK